MFFKVFNGDIYNQDDVLKFYVNTDQKILNTRRNEYDGSYDVIKENKICIMAHMRNGDRVKCTAELETKDNDAFNEYSKHIANAMNRIVHYAGVSNLIFDSDSVSAAQIIS